MGLRIGPADLSGWWGRRAFVTGLAVLVIAHLAGGDGLACRPVVGQQAGVRSASLTSLSSRPYEAWRYGARRAR
ncbi:hypothetical protein LK07_26845 [Streptomyces pluripotens]|uniref:Uncharacterized protein n=1 Tax=Streptomyces pluripotens TaxID=1355015 RepID=A0A221P4I0_9ACTN|nr:hypothetical protein LK06_025685 [Streptomyces pluripotens]ASN27034.1 hypothetical protein LK07_26845 [Streptomyces pluripotens]KIE23656.1 hypothetical protein LK08_29110 [Streptomyces sp. MUSC 125]